MPNGDISVAEANLASLQTQLGTLDAQATTAQGLLAIDGTLAPG